MASTSGKTSAKWTVFVCGCVFRTAAREQHPLCCPTHGREWHYTTTDVDLTERVARAIDDAAMGGLDAYRNEREYGLEHLARAAIEAMS
jgi:hypothetical protein